MLEILDNDVLFSGRDCGRRAFSFFGNKVFITVRTEMDFHGLLREVSPRLRRIAKSHNWYGVFSDDDDLYQEMCMHLWRKFQEGLAPGINTAYVIKSCEFHILNYLRKIKEKTKVVSLEENINENGDTLENVLPKKQISPEEIADRELIIRDIENSDFSRREKEVFSLLLTGFTVRETGKKIGVSHVMVVKIKKRIVEKWQKKHKTVVTRPRGFLLNITEK